MTLQINFLFADVSYAKEYLGLAKQSLIGSDNETLLIRGITGTKDDILNMQQRGVKDAQLIKQLQKGAANIETGGIVAPDISDRVPSSGGVMSDGDDDANSDDPFEPEPPDWA
jgi:hypothetical protein